MRIIPSALQAKLDGGVTTLCRCWIVSRSDGVVQGFPVKNHGRRARSLFALGLHTLRKIFVAASPAQIIAFLGQLLSPKLPVKSLLALAFQ